MYIKWPALAEVCAVRVFLVLTLCALRFELYWLIDWLICTRLLISWRREGIPHKEQQSEVEWSAVYRQFLAATSRCSSLRRWSCCRPRAICTAK